METSVTYCKPTDDVRDFEPNITGKQGTYVDLGRQSYPGALFAEGSGLRFSGGVDTSNTDQNVISLNASLSSDLFGKSSTVQPASMSVLACVKT